MFQLFDDIIFAFFSLEMTIKMMAMGMWGKNTYLADSWNRLDFFIVVAGAFEYCLHMENLNLTAIRTIRVLRPLRAINRIPSECEMKNINFKFKFLTIRFSFSFIFKVCEFWWCCCSTPCQCWEMFFCCVSLCFSSLESLAFSCGKEFFVNDVFSSFPITLLRPSKIANRVISIAHKLCVRDANYHKKTKT